MLAIRAPISVLGGTLFAAAIFFGLSQLVGISFEASPDVEATKIDFTPKRLETTVETKRHKKIERQPLVLKPELPGLRGDGRADGDFGLDRTIRPRVIPPGPDRTKLTRGSDSDVVPIVRPPPEYPLRALGGIEGWVRVLFSVTSIGTVRDARVVDSEPGTIFDEAALKAIARWRYNPRIEKGEAVERVGLQTIIRFELEN
jgi:protein TonB